MTTMNEASLPFGPPFPRIVVPIDGSPRSRRAAIPAAELAAAAGVPLTLFGLAEQVRDRDELDRTVSEITAGAGDGVDVNAVVEAVGPLYRLPGYVGDSIRDEAATDGALVCMATHGHGSVSAAVLGSVTEHVIRHAAEPVLVVGPHFDERIQFADRLLMVGLDGSRFAEQAIPTAAAWSTTFRLPLWLVEVAEPGNGPAREAIDRGDFQETSYLHRVARRYPGAQYEVVHDRHAAHGLVRLTEDWPVGLTVLATHSRSGLSRLVLGSVAMQVVHGSRCPVLLVPPTAV